MFWGLDSFSARAAWRSALECDQEFEAGGSTQRRALGTPRSAANFPGRDDSVFEVGKIFARGLQEMESISSISGCGSSERTCSLSWVISLLATTRSTPERAACSSEIMWPCSVKRMMGTTGRMRFQFARGFQAIHHRHPQIQNHQIRLKFLRFLHRLQAVDRFRANLKIGVRAQHFETYLRTCSLSSATRIDLVISAARTFI